jgi:predicted Zn-dependent peptidase
MELWFWMESERLTQPVFREFYSERDVVYEERRMRTESTPTGSQDEVFESLLWRGHPYGWPVVGWPSDISSITRQQAEDYFDLYYAPNNLTLALVGDFDEVKALEMANAYFGGIPRGKAEPPDVITLAMPLLGDLEYRAEVEAPPSVSIHFRTTAFDGVDDPALQLLSQVLSGKTGRLYKRLVLEEQIATSAGSAADGKKYDGQFVLSASGKSDVSPDRLKAVLLEEIEKIKTDGITDYELQKARNQLQAYLFRRLEDNFSLMVQLLIYDGMRDWTTMDTNGARIAEVGSDDVQRVAEKYFTADNRASKLYTRKESAQPEDPGLANFNAEQKQMISQIMANVGPAPAEAIPGIIGQLEQLRSQASAEEQAAVDYIIAKLRSRGAAQ